jgi:flagellar biosynthetic protein FliS
MVVTQPQDGYLTTKVQTSSPGELTLMLYSGCIRYIKLACACIERRDYEGKHTNFVKAQNIIDELQSTLNMKYELSQQLKSLYMFISEQLTESNIKMDKTASETCILLLSELRDTWAEALKTLKQGSKVQSL